VLSGYRKQIVIRFYCLTNPRWVWQAGSVESNYLLALIVGDSRRVDNHIHINKEGKANEEANQENYEDKNRAKQRDGAGSGADRAGCRLLPCVSKQDIAK